MQTKIYTIGVKEGKWEEVHNLLITKTCGCDCIPDRKVDCYDPIDHSKTKSTYNLTDEEVDLLKNHPDILWIELDVNSYPELYPSKGLFGEYKKRTPDVKIYASPLEFIGEATREVRYNYAKNSFKKTNWGLKHIENSGDDFFVEETDITIVNDENNYAWNYETQKLYGPENEKGSYYDWPTSNANSIGRQKNYNATNDVESPIIGPWQWKGPNGENVYSQVPPTSRLTFGKYKNAFENSSYSVKVPETLSTYYTANLTSITYAASGENVDIVCMDSGVLQYHPEFIDRFTRTTTDDPFVGRSRVRDLLLDGPYYLDPVVFNSGILKSHKTFKQDGRPTCTREGALLWWTNSSNRSSEYNSIGELPNLRSDAFFYYERYVLGSPQTSVNTPSYSESVGHEPPIDIVNASNDLYAGKFYPLQSHGTSVASVAAGRDFGSAIDARIWSVNIIGGFYSLSGSVPYDLVKIFHKAKKVAKDTTYAYSGGVILNNINKSPTVLNMSFGVQIGVSPLNGAIQASPTDPRGNGQGVSSTPNSLSFPAGSTSVINWVYRGTNKTYTVKNNGWKVTKLSSFESFALGVDKLYGVETLWDNYPVTLSSIDNYISSNQQIKGYNVLINDGKFSRGSIVELATSEKESISEMIESGVIAIGAPGNNNQYMDVPGGNDYNNYVDSFNYPISSGNATVYTNRRGSPVDGGTRGWDSSKGSYKIICVGAYTDVFIKNSGKNFFTKSPSSPSGPAIDLFAPGREVLAASIAPEFAVVGKVQRSDSVYFDEVFAGTSCAAPMVAGVVALFLEKNSKKKLSETDVDWFTVKNWLLTQGTRTIDFYDPWRDKNDVKWWNSRYNLRGSNPKILYNQYASPYFSFSPKPTFKTFIDSVPTSIMPSKDKAILLSPSTSSTSGFRSFEDTLSRYSTILSKYSETSPVFPTKTVTSGFGGRNNGGNAKWERQTDASNTYFAAAGGGGGGYYGGGGGNIGGGGGGGAGLAREDASDVATAQRGSNTAEGYARIWLNENADGSRASWKQRPLNR